LPVQQGVVEKVAHDLGELGLAERHLDPPGGAEVNQRTTVSSRAGSLGAQRLFGQPTRLVKIGRTSRRMVSCCATVR
jgi:hypothetical protein